MKYLMTSLTAFLFLLTAVTSLSAQNKNSVQGDLEALTDLYSATNGENWNNNSGWLNGDPSNEWYGVEVNSEGRVIRLDLYKNNLSGELPESIGNLSDLQFFSVKGNPIFSKIPASIANWVNAEILLFASDQENPGHNIPSGNSYNDHPGKTYHVSVAKYTGTIPDVFDKMPNLRMLQIAWQEDLEGQRYPSTLYSHPSLEILELHGTQLTGTLNDSFNLPEMRRFIIGNNHLEGELPASLGSMKKVISFKIGHSNWFVRNTPNVKRFIGPLPSTFSNFSQIKYFFIGNHDFSGELPRLLVENWPALREISLSHNNFTGEIPEELGDFNFTVFDLSNNNFSGTVHPNLVSGMQRVIIFNVRNNNLSGELPNGQMVNGEWKGWRTKKRLRTVTLDGNNFTGPLPDMPVYVGDMSLYTAHRNNFTGGIPDTWKELFTPELRNENPRRTFNNLQLRGNQLQGILPAWFTSENFDGGGIDVKGNRWSYRDILENGVNVGAGEQHDAPQLPFGEQIVYKKSVGSSIDYDYSHKVHSKDLIRWSKFNNTTEEWERDARFDDAATFSIGNIQESDFGSYRMELYNENTPLPDWVFSEPIIIEEGDGSEGGSGGDTDSGSGGDEGNNTPSFPSAPILYGPYDDAEGATLKPTFAWSDIGADYYVLNVSRQNPTGMQIDVIVEDTTFTPDEILGDSTIHDWRVYGVRDGEAGEWSEVYRFTTAEQGLPEVAELVSPEHFSQGVSKRTQLEWEDTGADLYQVRMRIKQETEYIFTDETNVPFYTPDEALNDTTQYEWQVRALENGLEGAWGPTWEFTTGVYDYIVEAPSLIAPGQGSEYNNLTPRFEWEAVDADQYIISVSKEAPSQAKTVSGKSTDTVVIFDETDNTVYIPEASLEPGTVYYWRVHGVKENEEGEWSETWEFTTPQQQNLSNDTGEHPVRTELSQNYPNPFNPTTQIEFTLSAAQNVKLQVYDMAGRQVATLAEGVLQAGRHTATFNASNLASGIYIYRFINDTHQFTRKMTLVK